MYSRILALQSKLQKKSHFLFGPRQTGKTTLVRQELSKFPLIQLLHAETFRRLNSNPSLLEAQIGKDPKIVVIDEIQRIPDLLNEVHRLIEERKIHFLLTGSSPRKLRRAGTNLLGGRSRTLHLHPLVSKELGGDFNLERAIQYGTLPSIYTSDDPWQDLQSYVSDYLSQEILAEGLSRNVPLFTRFLEVAALQNGNMLNFTEIASDAQVKRTTVHNYYEILQDTLFGVFLPGWTKGRTRKAISRPKFYFFDCGVVNALTHRKAVPLGTVESGTLVEAFILHELRSHAEYTGMDAQITYWRSTSGFEVDFLLNSEIGIEIKAKNQVNARDLRGLEALQEEKKMKRLICVYLGKEKLEIGSIEVIPFNSFIEEINSGSLWS